MPQPSRDLLGGLQQAGDVGGVWWDYSLAQTTHTQTRHRVPISSEDGCPNGPDAIGDVLIGDAVASPSRLGQIGPEVCKVDETALSFAA